ncbi:MULTISPECIES: SpoIIE family protein phosphatase [unclassified Streptomyces]|uniref:SpoIIE family protein phosphatase n=1 Tax=unclassified Streptomyces TaxID=2593676 RepID=UPI00382BE33B
MERRTPLGEGSRPALPPQRTGLSGRIPLAVVVVDRDGLVSHWSTGARKLFGSTREQAIGRSAIDLLPVSGALGDGAGGPYGTDTVSGAAYGPGSLGPYEGPDLDASLSGETSYPTAGRARLNRSHDTVVDDAPVDVLWWSYPLVGPGPETLLVLAADAAQLHVEAGQEAEAGGEFERIAPGFALHTEFPGAEGLAKRLPEILPSMGVAESGRIVSQVLELGYPVLEISRHDRVPVTPDWGVPRRAERRADGLRAAREAAADPRAAAAEDVEPDIEYAAVRERLEFLNEVSGRIGSSLDLSRTIQEVSAAVVPRFTDVAATYLRAQVPAGEGFPDGPPDVTTVWYQVAVEHTDEPGRWDDVVPVGESTTFPEHTPFFQCMTSGQPVLVPRITEPMGEEIAAQFEKRDIRPLITGRSMLVVPLKARDVVLGFVILLRHRERPPFNDMDRVTGAELAARAGLVLDNARMYTYQENIADTLQAGMLPQITARMPGCDVVTRSRPGNGRGRAGGDWFDAIKLPGSRVALVVGDVMAHGLHATAMMGQLRTAVQTMAALDLPPAQLLRSLDDLAQRLGENYLATCSYVVYDPVHGELSIGNAGHTPPVLVRAGDGRAELLDVPTGAPIGIGGVAFETVRVPVAPGDRLLLCTDGLVEARDQDTGTGLAALCESATREASSMDDACDTVIRALGRPGGRTDDTALLMARLGGIAREDVVTWQLALDTREVRRARALTRDTLERWGAPEAAETAALLVGEVVTNAVRHAHTRHVELRLVRADALLCEVTDDDHALPVLLGSGPEEERGRGLRIVSRLAREWGASRTAQGKTVWFEQQLPCRSAAART